MYAATTKDEGTPQMVFFNSLLRFVIALRKKDVFRD